MRSWQRVACKKLVLTLVIGVVVTLAAFWQLGRAERAEFQMQFERSAINRAQLFIHRMQEDAGVLNALKEHFQNSEELAAPQFTAITEKILAGREEIIALGWVPRVDSREQGGTRPVRKEDLPGPASTPSGRFVPDAQREVHYPIAYLTPKKGNESAVGIDLGTLPYHHDAMMRAVDSGNAEISPELDESDRLPFLHLHLGRGIKGGFLVMMPVFRPEMPVANPDERRRALKGFVLAAFHSEKIRCVSRWARPSVSVLIDIIDFSAPPERRMIWKAPPAAAIAPETWRSRWAASVRPQLLTKFNFAGHEFGLNLTADNYYLSANFPITHYAVLFFGLALTLVLGLYFKIELLHREGTRRATELIATNETLTSEVREIEHEKDDLRRSRNALEKLVSERTTQLLLQNKELLTEIAERRRAEEEMRRSRDEAEAANRAKDDFIAVLSHELRTPLTPVLASVSAMETDETLTPDLRLEMGRLRRNIVLEAKLIDDLLDMTRIRRGSLELHKEPVDIHTSLLMAREICESQITSKALEVSLCFCASQFYVSGDPSRLCQIFWNLLQNAIKFTPQNGRIEVRTANVDGRLRIEVADTGIGIEPEIMPRIFGAFEQGEKGTNRRFGGMGLGLCIAKALTEQHGGTLHGYSAGKGLGATFAVELETIPSVLAAKIVPAPICKQRSHRRILLVDDHADTRRILAGLLRKWGCAVSTADSVQNALQHLNQESFDLLVSDLGLPDGDGTEIMRHVKAHCEFPGIAVSGFGTDEDIRNSRKAGFAEHLVKPICFETLRAMIERTLP